MNIGNVNTYGTLKIAFIKKRDNLNDKANQSDGEWQGQRDVKKEQVDTQQKTEIKQRRKKLISQRPNPFSK